MKQLGAVELWMLGALAIILAIGGIAYMIDSRAYTRGKAEVTTQLAEANRLQREKEGTQAATASQNLENKNAQAKVVYRTINKRVDRDVADPSYRDLCFDDRGLRDANAALAGPSAIAGEPDGSVPNTPSP